jgi:SAM domain (Sterile alpha motif)
VTLALVPQLPVFTGKVWEPACSIGKMVAALREAGQYEVAFRENEIDETVLPRLTQENLKELGVTALGHRLKLLDAIAALRTDIGGKAPSTEAATTPSAPSVAPEDRLER